MVSMAKLRVAIFWAVLAIVLISTWAVYLWASSIVGFDISSFEMLVGLSVFVAGGAFFVSWYTRHLRTRRASQL